MSLIKPSYKEYSCSRNAPLGCDQLQQTAQQFPQAKFCLECGFPAILPEKVEIKGSRGTYVITRFLSSRGMGRLYSGVQIGDSQPVVIKEYVLPNRSFNAEEARQRQDTFVRVAGVSQADGRNQDFRLITPWEAIADAQGERCYTITKGDLEASQTLSQYLREKRVMTALQVREVLNQVLQTLQFLHTQKFRLPSGQVRQDLVHGNLNLESLLILQNNQQYFTIYLCDLAVWERLFEPPSVTPSILNPQQDLKELGLVAFSLLLGKAVDCIDPKDDQQFGPDYERGLKQFIYRLSGINTPFESAEAARLALLQLAREDQANSQAAVVTPETKRQGSRIPLILLGVLALLLLGGGIWYFLHRRGSEVESDDKFKPFSQLTPSFADVNKVPAGDFTYTGERVGTWSNVLTYNPTSDRTLQEEFLTKPNPNGNANFQYVPESSAKIWIKSEPIEKVKNNKAQFVITSLVDKLPDNLDSKQFAYDGLLVIVPFSYQDQNLPKALHGQITIEQLSKIYTREFTNWNQLGGPNLPIKFFTPTEPEAVRQFIKVVLKDDRQLIAKYVQGVNDTRQAIEVTQQQMVEEFNKHKSGIISYGIISKTWNQCAGYPLAIIDEHNKPSQALIRLNGQPIEPSDNICDKSNQLNVRAFIEGSYPLGYRLNVVYPKDNSILPAGRKFAEMLTTRQGQCLLSKVGLVPLQPVPENYLRSNDCKSMP